MFVTMDAWCEVMPIGARLFHEIAVLAMRADFMELYIVVFAVPVLILYWFSHQPPVRCSQGSSSITSASCAARVQAKVEALNVSGANDSTVAVPARGGWLAAVAVLPPEIRAEVSKGLQLRDLAASGMACRSQTEGGSLWSSPEVWHARVLLHHLDIRWGPQAAGDVAALRDEFRKAAFRTDGVGLMALFAEPPALGNFRPLFVEAAHVLRGLTRSDGEIPAKYICEILRSAFRSYDAMNDDMVAIADEVLNVARRRCDVLSKDQIQLLEDANDHAAQLSHILNCAMQEHEDQLNIQVAQMQVQALENDVGLVTPRS